MKLSVLHLARLIIVAALCLQLAGCEDAHVYGSVGFSSYSGGYYGPGTGGSVAIGGRIL